MAFHDVFKTGVVCLKTTKREAVAIAICGWAACQCGQEAPEKFGEGMIKLSEIVGESLHNLNDPKEIDNIMKRINQND